MTVGEAVRERILQLCQERGISVNRLCNISGVSQSTINNVVSGRNKSMTVSTVQKICDGLNLDLPRFFDSDLFRNLEQEIY